MVERMCRETTGPWHSSVRRTLYRSSGPSRTKTIRIKRLEEGCVIEVQSVELLLW